MRPGAGLNFAQMKHRGMGKEVLAPTILRKMADAENEHHVRPDREYGPMSSVPTKAIVEFADLHREVIVFARQLATLVGVP